MRFENNLFEKFAGFHFIFLRADFETFVLFNLKLASAKESLNNKPINHSDRFHKNIADLAGLFDYALGERCGVFGVANLCKSTILVYIGSTNADTLDNAINIENVTGGGERGQLCYPHLRICAELVFCITTTKPTHKANAVSL